MPALKSEGTCERTKLPFNEWSDAAGPKVALDHLIRDFDVAHDGQIALHETMHADFAALIQNAMYMRRSNFPPQTFGVLRMRKNSSEYHLLNNM